MNFHIFIILLLKHLVIFMVSFGVLSIEIPKGLDEWNDERAKFLDIGTNAISAFECPLAIQLVKMRWLLFKFFCFFITIGSSLEPGYCLKWKVAAVFINFLSL